jgi:hypothetical protein
MRVVRRLLVLRRARDEEPDVVPLRLDRRRDPAREWRERIKREDEGGFFGKLAHGGRVVSGGYGADCVRLNPSIVLVDAAARENMSPTHERHLVMTPDHQHFEACRRRAKKHDGRGRPRDVLAWFLLHQPLKGSHMKTNTILAALLSIGLAAGCADRAGDEDREARHGLPPEAERAEGAGTPEAVTVAGCLTEADGKFVLTQLEPAGSGTPTTETYQVVNLEDQLRRHVGNRVRVYGQADAPRVADLRTVEPSGQPAGAQGTTGQAQVDTELRARVETRTLRISTVTSTGTACTA